MTTDADAVDRLILDEAAEAVAAGPDHVVVVGDVEGALTLGAVDRGATRVRVHQDGLAAARALALNVDAAGSTDMYSAHPLDAELVAGARVVLVRLPKSLAELQEIAETVARHAEPDVVVFAGGRVKHMSTGMNDVLRSCFTDVRASLGRQKSRVLIAANARPDVEPTFPHREWHDDIGLWVCAHGGAFGGTKIDIGTRFLLSHLDRFNAAARTAVDLGCGTGILAAALSRARPALEVIATDDSTAAVASAAATMRANDLPGVRVLCDDAMATIENGTVDLVVCNPPFHTGTTVDPGAANQLFAASRRVLRPGGELWTVFNRHLPYERDLARLVGPTRVVGRNPKFTVAVSRVRG